MKKLMMAVAIVCAAAMAQASNVDWKLSGVGDYTGKNVYSFNTADQATVLAALAAGGDNIASKIAGLTVNKNGAAATISGSGTRAFASTTATGVDAAKSLFFVIFDGAIADGQKYAYSAGYDVSSKTYEEGQQSPGALTLTFAAAKTGEVIGAPEPTSGLLLLLGVGALALRRRRA